MPFLGSCIDNAVAELKAGDSLEVSFIGNENIINSDVFSIDELNDEIKNLGGGLDGQLILQAVNSISPSAKNKIQGLFDGIEDIEPLTLSAPGGDLKWSDFAHTVFERLDGHFGENSKTTLLVKRNLRRSIAREIYSLGSLILNSKFEMSTYKFKLKKESSNKTIYMDCEYHAHFSASDVLSTLKFDDFKYRYNLQPSIVIQ